ncbi:NAD(P)/FAD-dependent oxidoreductase [Paraclostridium sordellii]|uniref:NAD(P)/FAD-dependent oxidoreductase n=1 Tax=Paraclostridium sordellii TaxID=1505 RepID=UPI0005DD7922|nr:NAD(P)/FAD-dependent oxidoreductase [Paeniclostridium sordellii]MCH1965565.1 FAD-dependent oxidoreductase [Paeniclostridium sordellii]MDU6248140.1 NAD(P)/FAD-dependent oxidoreductase [Paeniclostridium sordellii]CEO21429.1 FAD dependent oxidoreductase [[Clostridium] sordellii] [Paeniclostridium sordellii]CEP42028.1 FAD dependent oxidoreductase [[Clostridium] sordellii] [Paeniclostridium sordellii]
MYDIAIIGAGISGSSIARELSKYNLKTVVIEKGVEVCQGTTKSNSAIVHGGYDAKVGSLKAKLNVKGNSLYKDLCNDLDVDFKQIGSLVLAFSDEEMKHVKALYERGLENKATGLKILNREEVIEIEPNINKDVVGALLCESAGIVCPFNLNIALMENAMLNGVDLKLESEVVDIEKIDDYFNIKIRNKDDIKAKYVINAAGVYADKINNMIGGDEYFIIPRKGEYKILDKSEGKIANHVLFQCPSEKGKGVLVTQTVHGNLLVGPNATVVEEKEDISTSRDGISEIVNSSRKTIENIDFRKTITSFAGLRATPNTGDFMIFASDKCKNFINVGGIESPGLASAPAVAKYVVEILKEEGLDLNEKLNFKPKRKKNKPFMKMSPQEKEEIIKKDPSYKKIVCRCESVTEGEIVEAINSLCGARTVDGVKRRVRPGMGRCQGGFCGPKVIEILARELNIDVEDVLKDYENSNAVVGKSKELRGELVEI